MSIENSLIRRQILNQRYARSLGRKYGDQLDSMINRVSRRLLREPNNGRLQRTLSVLQEVVNDDLEALKLDMLDDIMTLAQDETELLERIMNENATILLKTPEVTVIENAIMSKEMALPIANQSLTASQAIDQFNASQARNIRIVIQDSVLLGDTLRDTVKQLRQYADGRPRHQVEALARTLSNHATAQSRAAFAQANADVFDGEEWVSVLDSRTTLLCSGRDGNVYSVGQGPQPPSHFNCRSLRVPVLQKDFQAIGQKSNRENFDTWLKDQSTEFQDEYFAQISDGAEKARLFRQGKLELQEFRDEAGREYSIEQLRQLHPLAFDTI